MIAAFQHAQDALIMAIETVDNVLRDHNRYVWNNPELIVGVINVAGQVYTALSMREAISQNVDVLIEAQADKPEAPPTAH